MKGRKRGVKMNNKINNINVLIEHEKFMARLSQKTIRGLIKELELLVTEDEDFNKIMGSDFYEQIRFEFNDVMAVLLEKQIDLNRAESKLYGLEMALKALTGETIYD